VRWGLFFAKLELRKGIELERKKREPQRRQGNLSSLNRRILIAEGQNLDASVEDTGGYRDGDANILR